MRNAAEPFAGVDAVLGSELGARSLDHALRPGWIDQLEHGPSAAAALPGTQRLSPVGLVLLLGQLRAAGVVQGIDSTDGVDSIDSIGLTPAFRAALAARDLLEARLWFLLAIASDVHGQFGLLLKDPVTSGDTQVGEFFRQDTIVATIVETDPLLVDAYLPTGLWASIKVGLEAGVGIERPEPTQLAGRIIVVDSVFDTDSDTFGVRVEVPNPENAIPGGQRCRLDLGSD